MSMAANHSPSHLILQLTLTPFSYKPFLLPSSSSSSPFTKFSPSNSTHSKPRVLAAMATTLPATAASTFAVLGSSSMRSGRKPRGARYVRGLTSFSGLKARNDAVFSLGAPPCTAECFARVVRAVEKGRGRKGRGGALSSTCSAAGEIFRIAAIMNGLVLIGVAVGFVLLRVEAAVEEAE